MFLRIDYDNANMRTLFSGEFADMDLHGLSFTTDERDVVFGPCAGMDDAMRILEIIFRRWSEKQLSDQLQEEK